MVKSPTNNFLQTILKGHKPARVDKADVAGVEEVVFLAEDFCGGLFLVKVAQEGVSIAGQQFAGLAGAEQGAVAGVDDLE